jgi:hypothetical protein
MEVLANPRERWEIHVDAQRPEQAEEPDYEQQPPRPLGEDSATPGAAGASLVVALNLYWQPRHTWVLSSYAGPAP